MLVLILLSITWRWRNKCFLFKKKNYLHRHWLQLWLSQTLPLLEKYLEDYRYTYILYIMTHVYSWYCSGGLFFLNCLHPGEMFRLECDGMMYIISQCHIGNNGTHTHTGSDRSSFEKCKQVGVWFSHPDTLVHTHAHAHSLSPAAVAAAAAAP